MPLFSKPPNQSNMKNTIHLIILFLLYFTISTSAQTSNWTAVVPAKFPTNVSGQIHGISRISQLKFHATNPNKMYAVSARGGLFISTDAGTNWTVTPGTDFMPYARLASVCVDYTDDQIIYLGAGDHNYYYNGSGVWKSTNGGNTFTQTTLNNKLVVEMIMDPSNHNIIVAVTDAGIYKTTDAGATWVLKSAARPFDDLKQKTPVSRVLYAASYDSAFFRSTDFGDTWTQITTGIVLPAGITNGDGCRIAVTPADTNVVYLGMVANSNIIYKSTDGGTSFTAKKTAASPYLGYYANLSTSSGQGDYNFSIGTDRNDPNILYVVAHNVWKSTDGGVNWTQLTNWYEKVHTDMHQIITSPYDNTKLYNMNDGGVWLSTDGGNNWTPKSDGIYGYEIYHGNCSPTRRDMISIGTQDNGELYGTSTGWFTNRGGDWGSQCAFDYRANSSMVYYFENNKRRLVTGGSASYGLPAQVTLLHDIAFNRSNINLAFAADSFIYRTTNLQLTTPTWTKIDSTGKEIMAMHSSFADANRLYIITNDQKIKVSTNALSATPTYTTYNLPNSVNNSASITSIKLSPNTLYITANTRVYRSTDNGANWTNITYNLPSVNHTRIIADEYYSQNELVFIASNNTVYYKTSAATTWTIFDANLPTRPTAIDLSIYNDSTANSVLRYASYGRGMWETPLATVRSLVANFNANNINPCTGVAVQFSDLSTGNVTSRSWSFPGGTPSTSTASNPVVTYNTNGVYDVALTVSDGIGNNTVTKNAYISTNGAVLPLSEGFEGTENPPSGWKNVDNSTSGVAWAKTATAGGYGTSSNSMMFDNYSWNNVGEKDEILVKRLDLTGYSSVKLTFDVAYQIFSGYLGDSLNVLVSTDCGITYTKLYSKGGATLTSAGTAGNNFVPTAAQWRTDTVNLSAYIGQPSVLIAFQNRNGYGNKLYIDNINTISCLPPTAPTLSASSSVNCGTVSTALSIATGNLNSATNWKWYTGSCGGTLAGTGTSITVSPATTTTYFVRGEGGCVSPGACTGITITVKANSSSTTNATICTGDSYTFNGNSYTSAGTYVVHLTNAAGCDSAATLILTVNSCSSTVNLKFYLQGYYNGAGLMMPVLKNQGIGNSNAITDTVTVELRHSTNYSLVSAIKKVVNTDGTLQAIFSVAAGNYYVAIKHRNTLQTWSSSLIAVGPVPASYDFTDAANKAYGSNQILVSAGKWAFYTGDINQDENIDITDYVLWEVDYNALNYGYFSTDCNGDGNIDIGDYTQWEFNYNGLKYAVHP